ncbi:MAG TPA: hypothetical protein VEX36_02525 [Thermoleophilaceae bacterium]|nr:hypothetical protein [Thermoleophilaceae bacterium]
MSKAGRLGLVALAAIVVVVAFVIASPGDDDDDGQASNTPAETTERSPTATAPSALEPPSDGPDPVRIELTDHAPGSVESIQVEKGDRVRFVVTSDMPDDIHVHGYDVERPVAPGKPARFSFPATIEGVFEIESHEAEHAGKDALIARLVVEPS